jgi:hypothetical protein
LRAVDARGEKIRSVRWTVAVFDGRGGEDTMSAALGVDGGSTIFVGVAKGLDSCDTLVEADTLSPSIVMIDEEPHANVGLRVDTRLFSATATSLASAGDDVVSLTAASFPHARRQVIMDEGQPPFGTGNSA